MREHDDDVMTVWQGRVDALDGAAGRRWHQVVQPWRADAPRGVALVGFASDAGVQRNHGRRGGPSHATTLLPRRRTRRILRVPLPAAAQGLPT